MKSAGPSGILLETGATVDSHLADQIILYAALAHGDSYFIIEKATSHLMTNIEILKKFIAITINLDQDSGALQISGNGFEF